jgi:small-conductance mechanosensitive channel
VDVDVGAAYGSDPRQVLELLRQVSLATPGILPKPAPETMLLRFGPNSLDFGIRAWTGDLATAGAVRSDLSVRVHDALKQAGIEIPLPQQDVRIRSVPEGLARKPANASESSGD